MEEQVIYYIYRNSDKRYKTYTENKPETSNFTTIAPPYFNSEFEYPYFDAENNLWVLKQHNQD